MGCEVHMCVGCECVELDQDGIKDGIIRHTSSRAADGASLSSPITGRTLFMATPLVPFVIGTRFTTTASSRKP